MYIYKKVNPKRNSRTYAIQSSLIFLIIAIIALISLWLPMFFASIHMSGS